MSRTAHYVASTHWDREWYETFQAFRMRLVSLMDELLETFESDQEYKKFVMDGQVIPILDYLEIRPEKKDYVLDCLEKGKIRIGPWYVMPDEWLVSGESLVRNLQEGIRLSMELGAEPSMAGFACDMFGHVGQLPQIYTQLGITGALIWRGLNEKEHGGQLNWIAPDGTVIPSYRFGKVGYCSYAVAVRGSRDFDEAFDLDMAVDRLVSFTLEQAKRTPNGPILLFDGGDHLEIEPQTSAMIERANELLSSKDIEIVHSDLDAYLAQLIDNKNAIEVNVSGELRETGREQPDLDEQWLIPGVLSSRIHLKQRNALCEDELCLWAEPFSSFASGIGAEYPAGYLHTSWRHLLENHPHDSICGCSLDQVHQDMIYRFDQSIDISSRLTSKALKTIALAAAPRERPDGALVVTVFNATASDIDEPVDIDIPLPSDWPKIYKEFFGFEEKFSFRLTGPDGDEIPYQLTGQQRNCQGFRLKRTKFPVPDERHVVNVTSSLAVPAFGYTTLVVEPVDGPTRYSGGMTVSHRAIANDLIAVQAESNGTITLTDKRSGQVFEQLLTFEERADIGDGWYHGIAVNDGVYNSAASNADISVVADGINKATLRIAVTMNVPDRFNFHDMKRCDSIVPLRIVSDVTLRQGADRVEVSTVIENNVLDHRVRVLLPTGLAGDTYLSDSAFDVVERPIALLADNDSRRELDVETRPQISWTAFGDGKTGLAVVSRGLPESAVRDTDDRAIALTLLRGFRRAVLDNDNPGGQIQGRHAFRYDIVPYGDTVPVVKLFTLGQRINGPVRSTCLLPEDIDSAPPTDPLPLRHTFLDVEGNVVTTSVQRSSGNITVRLFNPGKATEHVNVRIPGETFTVRCTTLDGSDDTLSTVISATEGTVELLVPAKRITTVEIEIGA